jgi:hypothetical protein
MIKEHLPVDHNHTHHTHPRTLWDAFQGRGDMYVSEPLISDQDRVFVYQLLAIAAVSLLIFIFT